MLIQTASEQFYQAWCYRVEAQFLQLLLSDLGLDASFQLTIMTVDCNIN